MGIFHRFRTDESLMLCYQGGDVSAFTELYQRHKHGIFGFLRRACGSRSHAEDLAQETWTAVIKSASRYRPDAQFKTYLYRIARNNLIDHLRRQANRLLDDCGDVNDQPDVADPPLRQLEVQRLLQQIQRLPDVQREAFLLKEEGFSLQEIAAITDADAEAVKSRIRYARARLRNAMGQPSDAGKGNKQTPQESLL